jgi:hypothetical protein
VRLLGVGADQVRGVAVCLSSRSEGTSCQTSSMYRKGIGAEEVRVGDSTDFESLSRPLTHPLALSKDNHE